MFYFVTKNRKKKMVKKKNKMKNNIQKILLCLSLFVLVGCEGSEIEPTNEPHFRKARWGMSKEEVRKLDTRIIEEHHHP